MYGASAVGGTVTVGMRSALDVDEDVVEVVESVVEVENAVVVIEVVSAVVVSIVDVVESEEVEAVVAVVGSVDADTVVESSIVVDGGSVVFALVAVASLAVVGPMVGRSVPVGSPSVALLVTVGALLFLSPVVGSSADTLAVTRIKNKRNKNKGCCAIARPAGNLIFVALRLISDQLGSWWILTDRRKDQTDINQISVRTEARIRNQCIAIMSQRKKRGGEKTGYASSALTLNLLRQDWPGLDYI